MNFEYDGLHLMVDVLVSDDTRKSLADPRSGIAMIESIVEKVDMTMILPPLTVKFPHAVCEMKRILGDLEAEGLEGSKTAAKIAAHLAERKNESYGYSTFAMIAESHLSIHTFPELGYFSFDCYSCKSFDVDAVIEEIGTHFSIKNLDKQVAPRRIPDVSQI